MQESNIIQKNKQLLLNALALTVKELRGNKSKFLFASENNIPLDVLSKSERTLKDPQLSTLYKIAEAADITFTELAMKIDNKLPINFSLIDK